MGSFRIGLTRYGIIERSKTLLEASILKAGKQHDGQATGTENPLDTGRRNQAPDRGRDLRDAGETLGGFGFFSRGT